MQLYNQVALKQNPKLYQYLKENSYYFKNFNRDLINEKIFAKEMNIKYKERFSDKLNNAVDSMDLISSVLDILK